MIAYGGVENGSLDNSVDHIELSLEYEDRANKEDSKLSNITFKTRLLTDRDDNEI